MLVETPRMRNSARARRARGDRGGEVAPTAGELGQHGVEVGTDLGPLVDRAAVEADAGTAGERYVVILPVSGRNPCVGSSVVMRHCSAAPAQMQVLLLQAEVGEALAGGDPHLALHQVDIGHLFRDRVLDLDARIHLDEDDLAGALPRRLEQNSTVPAFS